MSRAAIAAAALFAAPPPAGARPPPARPAIAAAPEPLPPVDASAPPGAMPAPPPPPPALDAVAIPASATPAPPPVRTEFRAVDGMMDRAVSGIDGGEIGHVIDVLVDADGRPAGILVEVGGFLGVGERKVAVAWPALSFAVRRGDRAVVVDMTLDQVRAAPSFPGSGAGPGLSVLASGPLPPPPSTLPPERAPPPPPLEAADAPAARDVAAPYPAPLPAVRMSSRR